ncbi:energy transducer TonB [Paraglaciecola sp. 2405UD69-4]|uniref:energy transducer TonB n=1 Tax=Paraglaciecola sp. 2405UD69-4 TaxID=3391836 RepID=UPI0039C94F2B
MNKFLTLVSIMSVSWSVNAITLNAADLAASDTKIVAVEQVVPNYPNAQLLNKRSGNVTLTYDLNKQGQPVNIAVVDNSGPKQFVHTSMKALKNSRFQPIELNSQAVAVQGLMLQYDYDFESNTDTSITDLIALHR